MAGPTARRCARRRRWPAVPGVVAADARGRPLLARGVRRYTRRRSPLPTVAAMVAMAVLQLAAWRHVAGLVP